MDPYWNEWLQLSLRWLHVFAAILWIGSTAFFTWLDTRMQIEADPKTGKEQVWMVHSGGFYVVEKQRAPAVMPPTLHWWKWEAAITWLSGFLLLGLVYYMGGSLIWPDSKLSVGAATGIGVGALVAGWAIYDLLWMSPLGKNNLAGAAVCLALLVGAAYGLNQVFTGRAAYIHVGAIMGTIMTANVWMRIIPAQRRMVEAVKSGKDPDAALSARAKQRSKHNTFMAIPVTAIMISNHFPTTTYGSSWSWAMLGVLVLLGFGARKLINMHDAAGRTNRPA